MQKTFTLTIDTKKPVKEILFELELLANEWVEKDEDVVEIKYEKNTNTKSKG